MIEPDIPFELKAEEPNTVILTFSVNTLYYKEQFPYLESTIFSDVPPDLQDNLLTLLLDSSFALTEQNKNSYSIIDDNVRSILSTLLDHCQYFSKTISSNFSSRQTQIEYVSLMQRMLYYINTNSAGKISLGNFARQEHLSENYLSHLIKKISGATFKELLAFIRCRKAEKHLLSTEKRISEIAYLTGFSSPVYFKNNFKKLYGITPEEYRGSYSGSDQAGALSFEYGLLETKILIRDFADKHNIRLSMTPDRFFTVDTVPIDGYLEHFKKILSDEGEIKNIDAEMNESSHQAFMNMQKEFRMSIITIDASILMEKENNSSYLTIAKNINYLFNSGFKITFVIRSLSNRLIAAITQFMKFYFRRFIDTLEEISFAIKVKAPVDVLTKYKIALSDKLHEEIGPYFKIAINHDYSVGITYHPSLYDSFVLPPFAMDELFHPENWKLPIEFSLIDSVDETGDILLGGDGLLSWNGIKKPWWHAYNLCSKLRGTIISKGKDHIITNSNNHITILTYNTCGLPSSYLQSITSKEQLFDMIQSKGHSREHCFQLSNIFGFYKIITYSVNEMSCLFSKWAKLGYPEYLTLEEETVLSQICHPEVTFDTADIKGRIDITTKEPSFGVTCVVLEKYKD
ncbi:AraC family transcriptional regulator [bacterium 210820-DFI.6.37]|nr:AraC family transcriptional regulator [bacterium 210820-DFI.6.37]